MAWKTLGESGDVTVKVDSETHRIMIGSPSGGIPMTITHATYLVVLLDEAIALAKGEGTKLDKGSVD